MMKRFLTTVVAAGAVVAYANLRQGETEQNLSRAVAQANSDAVAYQQTAFASSQVANEFRSLKSALDARFRRGEINAAQFIGRRHQLAITSYRRNQEGHLHAFEQALPVDNGIQHRTSSR